jgi:hypothetical protein
MGFLLYAGPGSVGVGGNRLLLGRSEFFWRRSGFFRGSHFLGRRSELWRRSWYLLRRRRIWLNELDVFEGS